MSLVMIRVGTTPGLTKELVTTLRKSMQSITAQALHVQDNPAGRLDLKDVSVFMSDADPRDINTLPIEMIIETYPLPERVANADYRTEMVVGRVQELLKEYAKSLGSLSIVPVSIRIPNLNKHVRIEERPPC